MFAVDEVLVSPDVFQKKFVCHLKKCKGACCWKGDFGAPISPYEEKIILELLFFVKPYLSDASKSRIKSNKIFDSHFQGHGKVIGLHQDGSCLFLNMDSKGIARCSFELAYQEGHSQFKKPISCHLYPLRITENEKTGFQAINFDVWDICADACALGESLSVPVFIFAREAIIRKYSLSFFEKLQRTYDDLFS